MNIDKRLDLLNKRVEIMTFGHEIISPEGRERIKINPQELFNTRRRQMFAAIRTHDGGQLDQSLAELSGLVGGMNAAVMFLEAFETEQLREFDKG